MPSADRSNENDPHQIPKWVRVTKELEKSLGAVFAHAGQPLTDEAKKTLRKLCIRVAVRICLKDRTNRGPQVAMLVADVVVGVYREQVAGGSPPDLVADLLLAFIRDAMKLGDFAPGLHEHWLLLRPKVLKGIRAGDAKKVCDAVGSFYGFEWWRKLLP